MNSSAGLADGSMIWQAVFVSFAVILVLFELIRGWRLGLMRQLTRIAAIIAAYGAVNGILYAFAYQSRQRVHRIPRLVPSEAHACGD